MSSRGGKQKNASEGFSNMGMPVNLQDMTALSAGFFGCVCSQSPSGNWSETSLRRTAWKQNKDLCCRKPSFQKNLPLLVIILQKTLLLKLQYWIKSVIPWTYIIIQKKMKSPLQSQHSGFDYNVPFHYFSFQKGFPVWNYASQLGSNFTPLYL